MKYLLTFLIAFAVSGAMFGLNVLLQNMCYKRKHYMLQGFCMPFVGIVFAAVIMLWTKDYPINFESLANGRLWLIGAVTVLVSCGIVLFAKRSSEANEPLYLRCIEAATMEIPQRVFMQTFICLLLAQFGKDARCAIVINALVWCVGILISTFFSNSREWGKTAIELVSSFVFSLGIGYVFFESSCFVIPMVAHAMERLISVRLEKRLFEIQK